MSETVSICQSKTSMVEVERLAEFAAGQLEVRRGAVLVDDFEASVARSRQKPKNAPAGSLSMPISSSPPICMGLSGTAHACDGTGCDRLVQRGLGIGGV